MHGADVFDAEVDAYPSVFTICRGEAREAGVAVAENPSVQPDALAQLADDLGRGREVRGVRTVGGVGPGSAPWILGASDALGCSVSSRRRIPPSRTPAAPWGSGVATGADRVFIRPAEDLPVEPDRILPLALAQDAGGDGTIRWSGRALANPFDAEGELVDLDAYPRLRAYFEGNGDTLRRRHVARKNPSRWYRTIDRVRPGLQQTPKLLIPDIKGGAVVAFDPGTLYPHHNLYFVTTDLWDVRALQAVLRSRLVEFQVAAYAVRMRGGYLRFQAQYLRRIRLPAWGSVSGAHREALASAAMEARAECDRAAGELYGLAKEDWTTIRETLGS